MLEQPLHPSEGTLDQEFSPLSPVHIAHPYTFYARARQTEPVFFSSFLNAWVVTRYEDIMTVLKDHQRFAVSVRQGVVEKLTPQVLELLATSPLRNAPSLLSLDPPDHTRLRSQLTRAFSPQRIASLEPAIRTIANRLIDRMLAHGPGDFRKQFASLYPIWVIGSLLNIPEEDAEQIQNGAQDYLTLLFAAPPAEEQLSYAQSSVAFHNSIYEMAMQRMQKPQDDLISDLFRAASAGEAPLSSLEVAGLLYILVIAGYETTEKFLGNCLYHLLAQRERWEALQANPESIPQVVEEALRFDTPSLSTMRQTREEVTLGGKTLPQGAKVLIVQASANHDETKFPDAETFNPTRKPENQILSFGYGIHFCIGLPLARLESRIALEQLSQRIPSLRLVPGQDISYMPSVILHGLRQLLVEWDQ